MRVFGHDAWFRTSLPRFIPTLLAVECCCWAAQAAPLLGLPVFMCKTPCKTPVHSNCHTDLLPFPCTHEAAVFGMATVPPAFMHSTAHM